MQSPKTGVVATFSALASSLCMHSFVFSWALAVKFCPIRLDTSASPQLVWVMHSSRILPKVRSALNNSSEMDCFRPWTAVPHFSVKVFGMSPTILVNTSSLIFSTSVWGATCPLVSSIILRSCFTSSSPKLRSILICVRPGPGWWVINCCTCWCSFLLSSTSCSTVCCSFRVCSYQIFPFWLANSMALLREPAYSFASWAACWASLAASSAPVALRRRSIWSF